MAAPGALGSVDFSEVARQVQTWVDSGAYPGASVIVGNSDGVALERHFGTYQAETAEFIASAGKWLAAATLAAVVDRGLLSWDDSVGHWLPECTGEAAGIRLRQLLSHTSGIAERHPPGLPPDDHQRLAEAVARIAALPLREPPGTRFRYGGLAMQVAGRMAELAVGQSFEHIFDELLARPLGLERTRFTPVDSAPGHNPMLAGGARSSARDYARFLSMILARGCFHGSQLLSVTAIEELERDQVGTALLTPGEFVERARGATFTGVYGLGLWRERLDGEGRALQLSSPSWAGTYPWIDRERDLYGVLVTHVDLAAGARFDPFITSPVLADLVAAAVDRCRH